VRQRTRKYVIQGRFLEDAQRKSFQKYITGSMTNFSWLWVGKSTIEIGVMLPILKR
jgi:hypothetical protein